MGYDEINLNLGCPSGTVVSKNKGAGFLSVPSELDKFLYEIFSWDGTKISIKTRIGIDKPEEFEDLLGIFNKYPIRELTIHPRVQKDFYKNKPNLDTFKYALSHSKIPLCYNGDVNTIKAYHEFTAQFPEVDSIMIGRGLLINPGLTKEIRSSVKLDKNLLREFHDKIYSDYRRVLSGDVNLLYKMKEIWTFMILVFSNHEKYAKKIKKSTRLQDYEDAVSGLFREQEILEAYQVILNNNFSKV
jgi:tRNA-dihydrouridine synthase